MAAYGIPRGMLAVGLSALLLLPLGVLPAGGIPGPWRAPEGAVGGGSGPIALDGSNPPPHLAPFAWTNGNVELTLAGESPRFYVSSPTTNRTNVSVSLLGVAEVAPNGTVLAVGSLSNENIRWNLTWNHGSAGGLQVNLSGSVPVGPARGAWNASELPEADGGSLGLAAVRLVFHLAAGNATVSPWTVTFDLGVAGWPWIGASDHLGVVLSLQTFGSSSLHPGAEDVEERANATGSLIATVAWGPTASVTYANGTNATSTVSSGTSVSPDDQETHLRLLFGGVAGGYPRLFYDPNVTLRPAAAYVPGPTPGAGPSALLGTDGGLVGVAAGLGVVGLVGWAAYRRGSANPRNRLLRFRGPVSGSTSVGPAPPL